MERFDRAMRRHSAGDAAVELAIALDALLSDGESELTWKVSLRSALLAGGDKNARMESRAIIAAVYSLRSTVVHTGKTPPEQKVKRLGKVKTDELVKRGIAITSRVIRAAIDKGKLPDWFEEEIDDSRTQQE